MRPEKLGIIFDGGGFLGAHSVGYLRAVEDWGLLPPAYCQGVAVGSITASKFVEMSGVGSKVLEQLWLEVENNGPNALFSKYEMFLHPFSTHLFSNRGVWKLIDKLDASAVIHS